MGYVQKIFDGKLVDKDYRIFEERIGNANKFLTGILIHPLGPGQVVTVTLRYLKGTKPVFRKVQFSNTRQIDNIPYDLTKNFHFLNVPVRSDIVTGSISSSGPGKVSIYLRYD